jgi:hypothetical protein
MTWPNFIDDDQNPGQYGLRSPDDAIAAVAEGADRNPIHSPLCIPRHLPKRAANAVFATFSEAA